MEEKECVKLIEEISQKIWDFLNKSNWTVNEYRNAAASKSSNDKDVLKLELKVENIHLPFKLICILAKDKSFSHTVAETDDLPSDSEQFYYHKQIEAVMAEVVLRLIELEERMKEKK